MWLGLGEGVQQAGQAGAAIPVSKTEVARTGEECGESVDATGRVCSWYERNNKQADGSCACEFSVQQAGGRVLLAPGVAVTGLIDPKGDKFGWGGIEVSIFTSAAVWLGLGWWLWKSSKGGK